MPEIRQNPLTGAWVLFAPERAKRPIEHKHHAEEVERPEHVEECHFCSGNEHRTPPEVFALRDDPASVDQSGWTLRVFPNKFPAVALDAAITTLTGDNMAAATGSSGTSGLHVVEPGIGMHEVLVESPSHRTHLAIQEPPHVEKIIEALRHRTRMMLQARGIKYVCVFKNRGRMSGSSLEHPHMQIIGTAVIPPFAKGMIHREVAHLEKSGRGLFEVLVEEELSLGCRVVATNDAFVALTPWAAQSPYEVWIVPRDQTAMFSDLPDEHIAPFAVMLRSILARLYNTLDDPDYNLVIHGSPRWKPGETTHRWFAQVLPRLVIPAGFETGTGVYINPVMPEVAAETLRG